MFFSEISFTKSISALAAVPNNARETTIGPIAVPKELIPPAKFNLCDPVLGSPNEIAKGFAAVCCNEKPSPTIKRAPKIYVKAEESPGLAPFTARTIAQAPTAESIKPLTILLLNPQEFIISVFLILENIKSIKAPI